MGKKYFKQIDVGSINAGNTTSSSFTADRDYVIRKVFVHEIATTKTGTCYLNCTFRVDDYVFTLPSARGEAFDTTPSQAEQLDADFTKGRTFYYSITNTHSSSAISCYIVLLLEEK